MRPLLQKVSFDELDLEAVYNARAFLEGGVAALAAQNRTEDELEELRTILENIKVSIETNDSPGVGRYDTAFHLAVAQMSHNPILYACVDTLEEICSAYLQRLNARGYVLDGNYNEHYAVFSAIEGQDSAAAEQAMRCHAEHSKKFLLSLLQMNSTR